MKSTSISLMIFRVMLKLYRWSSVDERDELVGMKHEESGVNAMDGRGKGRHLEGGEDSYKENTDIEHGVGGNQSAKLRGY